MPRSIVNHRGEASMKIIGALVVIVVVIGLVRLKLSGPSSALGSSWHSSIDDGVDTAQQVQKPMIVLYTADWCPPCRTLKREVLHDDTVSSYLEQHFVLVKIDLSDRGGANDEVAALNGISGIPTMQAFDWQGNFLDVFQGPAERGVFMRWAEGCR